MNKKGFFTGLIILVVLLVAVLVPFSTAIADMNILSDGTWRSYDTLESEWTSLSFDDSSWRFAYEDYHDYRAPVLGASLI